MRPEAQACRLACPSLPPAAALGGTVVSIAPWPHFAFSLGFIKILMTSIFLFSFLLICVAVGNTAALGFVAGAWATHLCWCIGHVLPGWPGYIAQAAAGANCKEQQ